MKRIASIFLIAILYVAITVFFYQERVLNNSNINDLMLFYIPSIIAAICFGVLLRKWYRWYIALVISVIFTGIALLSSMLYLLNTYGS
jgi:flagellar biosynthesis protein FliQ